MPDTGELPRWRIQFEDSGLTVGRQAVKGPPGCTLQALKDAEHVGAVGKRQGGANLEKKQQALQQRALQPFMQIAGLCFMMYMAGSTLSIFSVMATLSGIAQPFAAILKSGEVFKPDPDCPQLDYRLPRLMYCLIYTGALIFALYKMHSMGLLPTHPSDWVQAMPPPTYTEAAVGPL